MLNLKPNIAYFLIFHLLLTNLWIILKYCTCPAHVRTYISSDVRTYRHSSIYRRRARPRPRVRQELGCECWRPPRMPGKRQAFPKNILHWTFLVNQGKFFFRTCYVSMYLCMYLCIYVHMYVCMYVCMIIMLANRNWGRKRSINFIFMIFNCHTSACPVAWFWWNGTWCGGSVGAILSGGCSCCGFGGR